MTGSQKEDLTVMKEILVTEKVTVSVTVIVNVLVIAIVIVTEIETIIDSATEKTEIDMLITIGTKTVKQTMKMNGRGDHQGITVNPVCLKKKSVQDRETLIMGRGGG